MVYGIMPSAGEIFDVTCVQEMALLPRLSHAQAHTVDLPGRTAGAIVDYVRICARTYGILISVPSQDPGKSDLLRICEHNAHQIRITSQQIGCHDECHVCTSHFSRLLDALLKE